MMPNKKGIGFAYDEHTEVPTFDEISSVFKPKRTKNQKAKKKLQKRTKHKKRQIFTKPKSSRKTLKKKTPKKDIKQLAVSLVAVLVLLAVFGSVGYYTIKNGNDLTSKAGSVFGKITGNFAVQAEKENGKPKFKFVIKKKEINITKEESKLILTMMANCESEKGSVAADIRKQKDAECERKIEPIQTDLDKCYEDKDFYKTKYNKCKDELDSCEGSE